MSFGSIVAGKKRQRIVNTAFTIGKTDTRMIFESNIEPNILLRPVIMRKKGIFVDIYRCMCIDFQKLPQSTSVVVVTVGQNGNINAGKIDTECSRIMIKQVGLPHIEEYLMGFGFNEQRETVFDQHIGTFSRVFKKACDFHLLCTSVTVFLTAAAAALFFFAVAELIITAFDSDGTSVNER